MSIEDNQIFLSGIESYDVSREETLINVNFCATFGRRIYFMKKPAGERTSVCMAAISAQQRWQHSMSLAANLLLVIDTGGRMLSFVTYSVGKYYEFRHSRLDLESRPSQL
jgi:hypothetical protein